MYPRLSSTGRSLAPLQLQFSQSVSFSEYCAGNVRLLHQPQVHGALNAHATLEEADINGN